VSRAGRKPPESRTASKPPVFLAGRAGGEGRAGGPAGPP